MTCMENSKLHRQRKNGNGREKSIRTVMKMEIGTVPYSQEQNGYVGTVFLYDAALEYLIGTFGRHGISEDDIEGWQSTTIMRTGGILVYQGWNCIQGRNGE